MSLSIEGQILRQDTSGAATVVTWSMPSADLEVLLSMDLSLLVRPGVSTASHMILLGCGPRQHSNVMFHRILCWHDEWVAEAEAWVTAQEACPGSVAMPDAFSTLTNPCEVK